MLFANVCVGVHQFLLRGVGNGIFWAFGLFFGALCIWEVLALLVYPFCVQGLGPYGVPPAGHALWAEVGGGMTFVTSGESAWQLIKLPFSVLGFRLNFGCGSRKC